ncbi:MAG TPA: aldo/keto reductase [Planococcus sp. (in: firmicutes)]|nr:aldo/keto reductase [Planococcus sp. (in: firmicutes)]
MKKNKLASSEIEVSEIGFGCMSLPAGQEEATAIIEEALTQGINYFDTADMYNRGLNEELVGKALKDHRKEIVLATKVGNEWHSGRDEVNWNASKDYITSQVHNSLKRLGTDYIDLYQLHGGMITDNTEETIEAFESLKKDGLIRAYGISSIRPNVIKRFLDKSDISSIMMQYSLLDRRPEEYFEAIHKAGKSVVTRGSLAKGLLTKEGLQRAEAMGSYLTYNQHELKKTLTELMKVHENLHALSIHSVLDNPVVASAVTGASSASQVKDTIKAYDTAVSKQQIEQAKQLTKKNQYTEHLIS